MKQETLFAALCVPLVVTVSPCFSADYLSIAQAQKILFPDATAFEQATLALSEQQRDFIKDKSGTRQRQATQSVWRATQGDQLLGWVLADDVIGKHEFISYAVGVSAIGEVKGVEILSYRETHGGQIREAPWREQFVGKTLHDPFKLNKDIANISGATLSCRNVTDGVKRLLVLWQYFLNVNAQTP